MRTKKTAQLEDVLKEITPLPWDAEYVCGHTQITARDGKLAIADVHNATVPDDADPDDNAMLNAAYINHCCNELPRAIEDIKYATTLLVKVCDTIHSGSIQDAAKFVERHAYTVELQMDKSIERLTTVNLINLEPL